MVKAIALLSGGLDSTLAVLVLLQQKIDVTAITFLTHFGCDISDSSSCARDPFPAAEQFGFTVKLSHLADKFMDIVKNPKYGHGKNMNPCLDCRILMLKEAKQLMRLMGADFLVTGEVLGQRPMSQRRDTFPVVDREADVEGLVLRPLSAKLFKPTMAEQNGLVDRDKLYAFSGRTRKPQMALAESLGLTDYPSPAGGCLLTDPIYSHRLRDLFKYNADPDVREINLLRLGRHFRLSDKCKLIIGRDQQENMAMVDHVRPGDITMEVKNFGSPLTLVQGPCSLDQLELAASMTARYSDAKLEPLVQVTISGRDQAKSTMKVKPAETAILDECRIVAPPGEMRKKNNRRRRSKNKRPAAERGDDQIRAQA